MNRLSACLITLNEEQNLPRALTSVVGIADEIVVVDCGSQDRTAEIAREFGAKLITKAWTNFAEQKNAAVAAASHDWILSLDADEELTPELRKELFEWKGKEPAYPVYEFARRAWYVVGWIRHSGWYPDRQRRLFRRDAACFSGIVHESLQFQGKAGRLGGDLLHYTIRSFAEHEEKVERYTTLAAQQMYAAGKRSWRGAMWLATPWNWFKSFVLQLGFLDGSRGWVIARMAARSTWLKFKKLGSIIDKERRAERVRTP
ncbi:MAG TPA: glycosyltransferase family 2 protein [Candidatus Acidoferrum sp.]|nr:glycosyltransferase family 2 protein [Candidatus Acidoferrum sp.]